MEHVLAVSLLSVLGFNLGLLLTHVFGALEDEERQQDVCVRLRRACPARR